MKQKPQAISFATGAPQKIHALTSLRLFAAIYVVCFHAFSPESRNRLYGWAAQVLALGYISVSFFFFLSGYILAMVYLSRNRSIQLKRFYVSRFARIYPLFLLTLVCDLPQLVQKRTALYGLGRAVAKTTATLVGHVFMLQAWTAKLQFALNPPAWSLSVETFCYICFPFLGLAIWKLCGRNLLIAATAIYIFGQLLVWIALRSCALDTVKYNPVLHLPTFALGICLYRWQHNRDAQNESSAPASTALYVLVAVSLCVVAAVISFAKVLPYGNLHDGLLAPVFAASIWALSYPKKGVASWLEAPWLVFLGESSFALYLIHVVVLHWYRPGGEPLTVRQFVGYFLVCVALSALSFQFFELPARAAVLRYFHIRSRESIEAASDA